MSTPAHEDPRVRRTRQALMDATWTLIENREGPDVSITEIAREAGVSRQALYQHYPDRDALLADAAVQRMDEAMNKPGGQTAGQRTEALLSHLRASESFYRPVLAASATGFYQHLEDYIARQSADILPSSQLGALFSKRQRVIAGYRAWVRAVGPGRRSFVTCR